MEILHGTNSQFSLIPAEGVAGTFIKVTQRMTLRHAQGILPTPQLKGAYGAGRTILRHAQVLGFNNGFVLAGLILLAAVPLCLLLQPSQHHVDAAEKAEEALEAEYLAD